MLIILLLSGFMFIITLISANSTNMESSSTGFVPDYAIENISGYSLDQDACLRDDCQVGYGSNDFIEVDDSDKFFDDFIHKKSPFNFSRNDTKPHYYNLISAHGVKSLYSQDDFVYQREPDRNYWLVKRNVDADWSRAEFVLPNVPKNTFVYIQWWFSDGCKKTELGLMKKEGSNTFKPLLFNTDDCYESGYFASRLATWSTNGNSKKRTSKYDSWAKSGHKYQSGDKVRMTLSRDDGIVHLWINGSYAGSVVMNHPSNSSSFGFEVSSKADFVTVDKIKLSY
uniref:P5 protein n=1 Tax=Pear chlorotic leaf spot-associated virus TaxID=2603627 RepID=A0A7D5H219_9VIRU|nr:P5 protein [Pear chlorotic leaf spot-associated virus]